MIHFHFDYETQSAADLKLVGVDNYAKHPTTKILTAAYAFGKEAVKLWQPHLDPLPPEFKEALVDPSVLKIAWNAGFERNITHRQLGIFVPYDQWFDPMVNARYMSMPGSLESVGDILGMPEGLKKIDGKKLLKLFSEPLPIKKKKKQATNENTLFDISPEDTDVVEYKFATPESHPEEWAKLCEYCKQDVVAERAIADRLSYFALPEKEIKYWIMDQKINDRGMPADRKFVECALELATESKRLLKLQQIELTGLANPNSNAQMMEWARKEGYPFNSLRKEPVNVALGDPDVKITPLGRKVLELRKQSSKTSYKKLEAILPSLSSDDRLRDQFLFMGSARAGRWSGKTVQMHNMARPIKALKPKGMLDLARQYIYEKKYHAIDQKFKSVIDVVTSCIRSAFVAKEGKILLVSDLNAIENRGIGWVAGEEKILDVFRRGDCPYLDFASRINNIPYKMLKAAYDRGDEDAEQKRQDAKPAVLGAGYRLGGGDWGTNPKTGDRVKTGLWNYAEGMGIKITKEEAHRSVKFFRDEYKKVVQLWYDSEKAVQRCLAGQGPQYIGPTKLIFCDRRKRAGGSFILRIHLPSGRCLHYLNAQMVEREMVNFKGEPYVKASMSYEGVNQETKKWELIYTHGGKIVENIVQAIARDILVHGMTLADELGMSVVGHFHDEMVCEEDEDGNYGIEDLKWCMSQVPDWAPGLILGAEGFETKYYKKG